MTKPAKLKPYEGRNIEWVDTVQVDTCAPHRVADLFAGAGGLSLGFEMAGCTTVLAVDADADAAATHATNFPSTRLHSGLIEDLSDDDLRAHFADAPPDVICGGPPCQSHSMAGRRDPDDPRGHLYQEFLRVANVLRPHFLVIENVPGLLSIEQGARIQRILDGLADIGYPDGAVMMLEAAEYGVPQMRRRLFVVANRHNFPNPRPLPLLSRSRFVPVESAIDDLKARLRDAATSQASVERYDLRDPLGGVGLNHDRHGWSVVCGAWSVVFRYAARTLPPLLCSSSSVIARSASFIAPGVVAMSLADIVYSSALLSSGALPETSITSSLACASRTTTPGRAGTVTAAYPGADTTRLPLPVIVNAPSSSLTALSLPSKIDAPAIGAPASSAT
jgi:hypothetical protein